MTSNRSERRQGEKREAERRQECNLGLMQDRQMRRQFRRNVERRNHAKDDGESIPNLRVFRSAIDVFQKLKHEVSKLETNIHVYDFFNFVITAHILQEWLLKDSTLPDLMRLKAKEIEKNQFWQVCKEISNGNKHFYLDHETKTITAISHVKLNPKSFDWGLSLEDGGYEAFVIGLRDGHFIGPRQLEDEILKMYEDVFKSIA
jgi:hypothetical protein